MSTVVYKRLQNVLLFVLTLSAYLFDTRPSHQLVFGGVATIAAVISMVLYFHRDGVRRRSN